MLPVAAKSAVSLSKLVPGSWLGRILATTTFPGAAQPLTSVVDLKRRAAGQAVARPTANTRFPPRSRDGERRRGPDVLDPDSRAMW